MDRATASTSAWTSKPTYPVIQSGDPASPAALTTLQPRQPMNIGILYGSINSLRIKLDSATSSADSLSSELGSSLASLQTATASLEASASSAVLAVETSASNAVAAVKASASSALSAAGTSPPQAPPPPPGQETGHQISRPVFAISISVSIIATALLTLLAVHLFYLHRRMNILRRKRKAHQEETAVNNALDRAIVSYIAKEPGERPDDPNQPEESPAQPDQPGSPEIGQAVTTVAGAIPVAAEREARVTSSQAEGEPPPSPPAMNCSQPEREPPPLPTPAVDQRKSSEKRDTFLTDTTPSLRRTASSRFSDSADSELIYGGILANPLESVGTGTSIEPAEPTPAKPPERKDDVGWPLTKEGWL